MTKEDKIIESAETAYPYNDLRDIAFIEGATSEAAKEYFDPIGFAKFCMENAGIFPKDKGKVYSINENPLQVGWTYEELYKEYCEQFKNKK